MANPTFLNGRLKAAYSFGRLRVCERKENICCPRSRLQKNISPSENEENRRRSVLAPAV